MFIVTFTMSLFSKGLLESFSSRVNLSSKLQTVLVTILDFLYVSSKNELGIENVPVGGKLNDSIGLELLS